MPTHATRTLAPLTGTLMTVDIDDVQIGDVMFMGGHLVRRVTTVPSERTYRKDHMDSFRVWLGIKVDEALGQRGTIAGEYNTPVGQACLIMRPPAVLPARVGLTNSDTTPTPSELTSIRALLFGAMVQRAVRTLGAYHSDLFHDALWLEKNFTGEPLTFEWLARESGTNIGESAEAALRMNPTRRSVFYRIEVTQSRTTMWVATFTVVDHEEVLARPVVDN